MINLYTKFNYLLLIFLAVSFFIFWDMYPLWKDYQWRYLFKKSYKTGTSLDKHYQILDNIIHQTGDFEGHIGCSGDKIHFFKYPRIGAFAAWQCRRDTYLHANALNQSSFVNIYLSLNLSIHLRVSLFSSFGMAIANHDSIPFID